MDIEVIIENQSHLQHKRMEVFEDNIDFKIHTRLTSHRTCYMSPCLAYALCNILTNSKEDSFVSMNIIV